jgi:hypothetical protein
MTRRCFFLVPLFGLARAWGATGFWNRKSPREWTDAELHELTTKSPWAQDARIDPKTNVVLAPPEEKDAKNGAGRPGARAVVCWESAKPILDALGNILPGGLEGHYVIGVKDRERQIQPLTASATLEAKGKEPVQAGVVVRARDVETILFGFSRELLPLTVRDREVLFSLDTDQVAVKAKFDPKEMIYRGQLAL